MDSSSFQPFYTSHPQPESLPLGQIVRNPTIYVPPSSFNFTTHYSDTFLSHETSFWDMATSADPSGYSIHGGAMSSSGDFEADSADSQPPGDASAREQDGLSWSQPATQTASSSSYQAGHDAYHLTEEPSGYYLSNVPSDLTAINCRSYHQSPAGTVNAASATHILSPPCLSSSASRAPALSHSDPQKMLIVNPTHTPAPSASQPGAPRRRLRASSRRKSTHTPQQDEPPPNDVALKHDADGSVVFFDPHAATTPLPPNSRLRLVCRFKKDAEKRKRVQCLYISPFTPRHCCKKDLKDEYGWRKHFRTHALQEKVHILHDAMAAEHAVALKDPQFAAVEGWVCDRCGYVGSSPRLDPLKRHQRDAASCKNGRKARAKRAQEHGLAP